MHSSTHTHLKLVNHYNNNNTECLLRGRYYPKHFTYLYSFNLCNNLIINSHFINEEVGLENLATGQG